MADGREPRTTVVAICSAKGGVGNTALALNLAYGLAARSWKSRDLLSAMSSDGPMARITVESQDLLVAVRDVKAGVVCGLVFPSETPLGLIRVDVRRMIGRIRELLPAQSTPEPRALVRRAAGGATFVAPTDFRQDVTSWPRCALQI